MEAYRFLIQVSYKANKGSHHQGNRAVLVKGNVAPGSGQVGLHPRREWVPGDNFRKWELKEQFGFRSEVLYESCILANVINVEAQLQNHFQDLPLGKSRLWRHSVRFPSHRAQTEVGCTLCT